MKRKSWEHQRVRWDTSGRAALRPLVSRCAVLAMLACMTALGCAGSATAQPDTIFADGFELPPAAISPDPAFIGSDSHVAVGSDGRVHMVYTAASDSNDRNGPVRYGECAAGCMNPSHWAFLTLGSYGSSALGGGARLALTTTGHPRVWWYEQSEVNGPGVFHYARCDANCAAPASWSVGAVLSVSGNSDAYAPDDAPFALDSSDHPHFFLQNFNGVYYGSCTSGCTSAGSWSYTLMDINVVGTADIALRFAGLSPTFLNEIPGPVLNGGGSLISYGGCCQTGGQWVDAAIYKASSTSGDTIALSLALTRAGLPRAAFYQVDASGTGVYRLVYGACNASCGPSGWSWVYPGVPQSAGFVGIDLVLDGNDHPYIAFGGSPDSSGLNSQSVSLTACTSNCAQAGGLWNTISIETSASIPLPIPSLTGADAACSAGSQWFVGAEPSLALNAGNGAYLSWDVDFLETCPNGSGGHFTFSVPGPIRYAQR